MTAKEMFCKLGYEQIYCENKNCTYVQNDGGYITQIEFIGIKKGVRIHSYEEYNDCKTQDWISLDEYELKAINKQIQEMEWFK